MNLDEITILIIAQNESKNIQNCILSLGGMRSLVVDGLSTDNTVELARNLGAKTISKRFEYYAKQYNYGIQNVETPWVFVLDADERFDVALLSELAKLKVDDEISGYIIKRFTYFGDRKIRWGALGPDSMVRLMRKDQAFFEDRQVHARIVISGKVGLLKSYLHHYSYVDVNDYLERLIHYTSLEGLSVNTNTRKSRDLKAVLKRFLAVIPFRPFLTFIYMYFLRLGFLEGKLGFWLASSGMYYQQVVNWKKNSEHKRNSL